MQQKEDNAEQDESKREEIEAAFRRGFAHGTIDMALLVVNLMKLGYKEREIKRLLAVYDDHFVAPWRYNGDLTKREAPPVFDLEQCQEILEGTTGYDWIE